MHFSKKSLTQWVSHRCERQLGLSLWSDRDQEVDAALREDGLGLPHRQLRPGLQQMANAGSEWAGEKMGDLLTAFGEDSVLGHQSQPPQMHAPGNYRFASYSAVELANVIGHAEPGRFIVEAQFDPVTSVFEAQWNLEWRTALGLRFSEVRPDLIQVGHPGAYQQGLTVSGELVDLTADPRIPLRVIDLKLSSQPGPGYFAEVTYYSAALAAWLEANGLAERFVVAADAALWVGSHEMSILREQFAAGITGDDLRVAFERDLLVIPTEVFISELHRFLMDVLPRVAEIAATERWSTDLRWHVAPSCGGCDYLGQSFPGVQNPGTVSAPHENHCVPTAASTDHLSRLPYLPRGGTTLLSRGGIDTTAALAGLDPSDVRFDQHHSLRANRAIIPSRAAALATPGTAGPGDDRASTAAIPRWSDLSLFVTADFDPTSAITLAFGLSGIYLPSRFGPAAGHDPVPTPVNTYYVESRSVAAEQAQLLVFLTAINDAMAAAQALDPDATVQVYVWDTLTFDHLTRVVGRHLTWLLATNEINRLAWLFPPEELVENPRTTLTPAVSVVSDAVRGVLATSEAHTYTLLGTAAIYNEGGDFNPSWLETPGFWTTEFSDQIPGERAFDLWTRRNRPNLPYSRLVEFLNWTVRSRHRALSSIVRRLRDDLRGQLPRVAPKVRHLEGPGYQTGTSMLGSLLFTHSKLNAAIDWQKTLQIRATAPHEREARFASIVCETRLDGQAAQDAADTLEVARTPAVLVFQISQASAEAKVSEREFSWAISAENAPGILEQSLFSAVQNAGLNGEAWWTGKAPWVTSFEDTLQVTIRGFSRDYRLVAVEMAYPDMVDGLTAAGIVDLNGRCILDPVSKDFLSRRIAKAARAIGNPPKAAAQDAEIRAALNVRRGGPRRSASCPAEDYLWDARPLEIAELERDIATLRASVDVAIQDRGEESLNAEQWDAWEHALTRRLTLIWGPPGTGKSRTVGMIIDGILHDAALTGATPRILLTAGTYAAIDNVLSGVVARHADRVPMYRVRSAAAAAAPVWAVDAGVDTPTGDGGRINNLVQHLSSLEAPVVVGATSQQAQRVIELVTGGPPTDELFDFIIIDEGGALDVGQSILVLAAATWSAQVVVAGDPLQLPPIHHSEPPEHLAACVGPVYSFFRDHHQVPEQILLTNYRSNAEIVELARHAGYPPDYLAADPALRLPLTPANGNQPPGWPDRLMWDPALTLLVDPDLPVICVTYPEGLAGQWNQFEADLTVGLAAMLSERLTGHASTQDDGWLWAKGLGIVTPHRAQRSLLVAGLTNAFPAVDPTSIRDAVDTVERFQGQERHAILASYAVGDPDTVSQEEDFLQDLNRFNVLATRAKSKLIVVITDDVLAHIASDIDVIRGSRLIKSFADTFCTERQMIPVIHRDPDGTETTNGLTVRWRPPATPAT